MKCFCCEKCWYRNLQQPGNFSYEVIPFASFDFDFLVSMNLVSMIVKYLVTMHLLARQQSFHGPTFTIDSNTSTTLGIRRPNRYSCRGTSWAIWTGVGLHPTFLVDEADKASNIGRNNQSDDIRLTCCLCVHQILHLQVFWLLLGTLVSMGFLWERSIAMHSTHPQVLIIVCRLAARDRRFSFISVQIVSNRIK